LNPVPVTLITGFLGSGKTTFLRRLAEKRPEARYVFLINELASVDMDGPTLAHFSAAPSHSVVGGSLFCECKAGDFLRVLRDEVLPTHREAPLDALIIETSGMADPNAIGTLLEEKEVRGAFVLHRMVTIVAPARFSTLVKNLPVAVEQVRGADVVLLNKCDLADAVTIDAAEAIIRTLNPSAEVIRACHGEVDLAMGPARRSLPLQPLSTCEANPFTAATISPPIGLSREALETWLASLPPAILRVKGVVATEEGQWLAIEKTVDSCEISPIDPRPPPALVLIVHDDDEGEIAAAEDSLRKPSCSPIR
jgi:G3E family GTPase